MMVNLEEVRYTRKVQLKFLVVPCRNINNCIFVMSFTATLNTIAFPINLKVYHNVHDEPVTICDDLSGAQMIHKTLQHDQK